MNSMIQTDSYKLSHKGFMNDDTQVIYSNLTARSSKHFPIPAEDFDDKVVVFGVGSFTMQYMTRDSLGMAVKATAAKVDGKWYELFKDPVTDDGVKKSAKGLLRVDVGEDGELYLQDQQTPEQEAGGMLQSVFKDGELVVNHSFEEIRKRLWG